MLTTLIGEPASAAFYSERDIKASPLPEGGLVSSATYGDPDIYILGSIAPKPSAISGYKRLFLNPVIFNFYGHLGGFANVRQISMATRDMFETSGLFRNCQTNDQRVWAVEVVGEDSGVLHHVQMTGEAAVAQDPYFFSKVFCINSNEENWYAKSPTPYTSLSQIPRYSRTPASSPTPSPTPVPQHGPVTVQSVQVNVSNATVTVTGYLPTPCYAMTNSVTRNGLRYDVTITATTNPDLYCIQVIHNFTQTMPLGDLVRNQTYELYVNGSNRITFYVP